MRGGGGGGGGGGGFLPVLVVALIVVGSCLCCCPALLATDVSHDGRAIVIDGERRVIFSGSIHYPRSTPEMWPELIKKAKEGGLDAIETYVFWNAHEPRRGEYNFEGNLDMIRFLKEVQNAGLYAVLRIGPYVCAEWNFGGLPVWLHQTPGLQMRTDNQLFKDAMQNFTTLIVTMVKQEKLLATQGGPIILTQIENEYGNIMWAYGEAGKSYMQWCAKMAQSLDVGVPWIMCQQSDAPQPMINTCNGFYCDNFKPNNPNSPKMWTENWTGWFKAWDKADPHRPVEDVAFAVARFYQTGGTFQNYYMYHGGTNFGRTSGGPYITTTYDYDAPLDEYGNLRQPKWGHLKELHASIKMIEKAVTYGDVTNTDFGHGVLATKYFADGITTTGCFLANTNTSSNTNLTFEGNSYYLPAWSVSILLDCKKEIHNTAKINVQTSVMVKRPNQAEEEPTQLSWSWRPEKMKDTLKGKGSFTTDQLLEQITTTGDSSDYLWYMTRVNLDKKGQMTLRVNTTGHVLHAFVNGRLTGSQYAPNGGFRFVFESPAKVKAGENYISLLSATVGLKNYGDHYELMPAGIVGGPVQLFGGNVTRDLSSNEWSYKIGLNGEDQQIYLEDSRHKHKWHSSMLPTRRPFTWYKTAFRAPLGEDPVVIDLKGMGKGEAWVNGHSIGRFWPISPATSGNCGWCDYRGPYNADQSRCRTGCGGPTQRWYHVPRSFLKSGESNVLVLLEEAGGDPSQVNFQTVAVGTVCGNVPEGKTLALSCQGDRTFSDIQFAGFGDIHGWCGSYKTGSCDAAGILFAVHKACVGQASCSIEASEDFLGKSNCGNLTTAAAAIQRRLAVQLTCSS